MHRSRRARRSICGACGLQAASGCECDERKGDDCREDFADHKNSLPAAAAEWLPDLSFFELRQSLAGFGVDAPAARGSVRPTNLVHRVDLSYRFDLFIGSILIAKPMLRFEMTLRELRYLVALAAHEHFGRAAEE